MSTGTGTTTDRLLAAWERSTDWPIPPFVAPVDRRPRVTGALVLVGILLALLAGALVVGPLASLRPIEPTLEAGLASLERAEAFEFRLRLEISTPDGSEGLLAEGAVVPSTRALTATGQTLRPDGEWPFGPVGTGALVFADGRLFVRHGSGPWDEVEPAPPNGADGPVEVLARLLDTERLGAAIRAAVADSDRVASDYAGCAGQRCARHDIEFDRVTMHALVEAVTGLQMDAPQSDVSPLVATFLVDPDGNIVSLDAGFSENDGTIRFHLELSPLDAAPSIEPPLR
jgi:hypothetical protein